MLTLALVPCVMDIPSIPIVNACSTSHPLVNAIMDIPSISIINAYSTSCPMGKGLTTAASMFALPLIRRVKDLLL